jgi:hypothetical protein
MPQNPEPRSHANYRTARKAFIKACDKVHADAISRVHPKLPGPDGKPLFIDSVALGPRPAKKAALVIADGADASETLTALLEAGAAPPEDARLVLVHAFDPFSFAGASGKDPDWSLAMLRDIATEDLAQVTDLTVLALGTTEDRLAEFLTSRRPRIRLDLKQLSAKSGIKTLRKMLADAFSGS